MSSFQHYQTQLKYEHQLQRQDQSLSFDNMLKVVSTFETLANKYEGLQKQKQWKSQDFFNYESKNIEALKDQAKVQLYSFATSKFIFDSEYPNGFKFPKSLSRQTLGIVLKQYKKTFNNCNANQCQDMVKSLEEILDGKSELIPKALKNSKICQNYHERPQNTQAFINSLHHAGNHSDDVAKGKLFDKEGEEKGPNKEINRKKVNDICKKINEELKKDPNYGRFKRAPFLYGTFYEIKEPMMDFDAINYRIQCQSYNNVVEYIDDVRKVWVTVEQLQIKRKQSGKKYSTVYYESDTFIMMKNLRTKFDQILKKEFN